MLLSIVLLMSDFKVVSKLDVMQKSLVSRLWSSRKPVSCCPVAFAGMTRAPGCGGLTYGVWETRAYSAGVVTKPRWLWLPPPSLVVMEEGFALSWSFKLLREA